MSQDRMLSTRPAPTLIECLIWKASACEVEQRGLLQIADRLEDSAWLGSRCPRQPALQRGVRPAVCDKKRRPFRLTGPKRSSLLAQPYTPDP
ncbi:hypothetical protein SKAU_G00329710 [Synaphobranchus kaupii]|uniref:Uncharacterized protein n=1 Tax=Synaphobranchus kaupii TaxID=118154 RepID=A0A9Q1EQA3_SYNKA|nr:hypothetical protein SKAU_G00329710 [Synaphobranchus kaupii]